MRGKQKAAAARKSASRAAAQTLMMPKRRNRFLVHIQRYFWLYVFMIPGFLLLYLFKLRPIYGLQIASKDFNLNKGIWGSDWVGLKHFQDLFRSVKFTTVLKNSIVTSLLRLLFSFPVPIILALALNEMSAQRYKKTMQTILYLPHFVSWVVVVTMLQALLSESTGIINNLIKNSGGQTIPFLSSPKWFRPVLITAGIWKECGWGTVIYLAALAGIDPALYEAAMIDGANRWQRMRYITLPCIMATITIMLIMQMGSILSNGFEQIWLLQNSLNKETAEVLETYSYQVGLREGRYSFATAIGMFQSLVGCIMVFLSNFISKKTGGDGLW